MERYGDRTGRRSLLPEYLYSSRTALLQRHPDSAIASLGGVTQQQQPRRIAGTSSSFLLQKLQRRAASSPSPSPAGGFMIPAPSESGKIQMYSTEYFLMCGLGGLLCCGLTHTAVTPMDVVKCNMQIAPKKYTSIPGSFKIVVKEEGLRGLYRGWAPTFVGYCIQGAGKYGFYEYFKKRYADAVGPENAAQYKTLLFLGASASAEFIADLGLCPFEAVKVRVQTQPGFAKGLADGMPKLIASDGFAGLYKGLVPLWGRQIPYTMMKFATFESTVEALYKHLVPVPKSECSSGTQLGVSFAAGYIAGIACAIISHPADNLVSFLNNAKGATVAQAVQEMGVTALLTRGLPLRIVMIGTLTAAQWAIYDSFKVYYGFPTTGSSGDEHKAPLDQH
ncbi:hypothetical protein KC19_1G042000 [Ceratodon purpureus]|uniref:Uncharacterized protein n=1 Tax=Ceratodon purpureus TaxID=3225 RepID=A0A8T0J483_CERPU|nr:hypothetical protein KC19_1G042000 [Ceratodon purpureus]